MCKLDYFSRIGAADYIMWQKGVSGKSLLKHKAEALSCSRLLVIPENLITKYN